MKIKITDSIVSTWYNDFIGQIFEVKEEHEFDFIVTRNVKRFEKWIDREGHEWFNTNQEWSVSKTHCKIEKEI